jgi:hypothetical protein
MTGPSDKPPQSGDIETTELILRGSIARVPIALRGAVGSGGLQELSGSVAIDRSLSSLLGDLAADFGEAVTLLEQLLGDNADISLQGLAFGYNARAQQKSAQVAVRMTAGTSSCDFLIVKGLQQPGGFIAGLRLRSNKTPFQNNPLRGLIGEVAIGELGIYYASAAFPSLQLYSGDAVQDVATLTPQKQNIAGRDFAQGLSFSAEILVGGANLLDRLGLTDDQSSPPKAAAKPVDPQAAPPDTPPPLGKSTTWIKVDKTIGPLSIRRIGLGYDAPSVGIKLDAGLRLSCLTLSLEGLGLSFPLEQLTRDPTNIWRHLRFDLDGAAVAFEQGPLTISGGLLKVKDSPLQIDGALLIRTQVLTISALASYADVDGTPSFFVFAALQKELGGPAFFFVTGLAFGFGINRALTLPSINEVQNFPLIKAATDPDYLGTGLDLRAISVALDQYIYPSKGNFWIAAGVKFTSFGMIDSFALISVSFGTRFELALLGLCKLLIPKQPPGVNGVPVIAYAEMAIKVVFAPDSGLLSCEARLTENSFVLRKDFKLRGGFAFYSWFAGEHEGDFVVSIGGYHPKFLRPAHYPQPDLVQFNCKIGDVTIEGHCYFALCPSAVMAGGGLSIVYESGGIRAWFIAYADFLVQWKPLYYDIAIGVSIGVALNLKIGIIRVHLAVELSASLALYGPPLGGTARISLYVVSFTVSFGENKRVPPPLLWESNDAEKSFAKSFLPNPKVTTVSIVDGLIAEIENGNGTVRLVNPHRLVLSTRSLVPATEARFNGTPPTDDNRKPLAVLRPKVNGRETDLGVRSMGKTTLYSLVDITFEPAGASANARKYLEQYLAISLVTKSVPLALWGAPVSLVTPPRDQVIDDALVGLEIRTKPGPRPWETPALDLKVLAYDRYTKSFEPTTTGPKAALPAFGSRTISNTVEDSAVVAMRTGILAFMAKTGRRIIGPEDVDLEQLKESAQYIFQAMPAMTRVGQYPPRGYLE